MTSTKDNELLRAQARAFDATQLATTSTSDGREITSLLKDTGPSEGPAKPQIAVGSLMSGLMKHGGVYTLSDTDMMAMRFNGMLMGMAAKRMPKQIMADLKATMKAAPAVPTHFFYHLVDHPYRLHSQLVSYLSHPARHLRSPVSGPGPQPNESAKPYWREGQTYSQSNKPSRHVPAAITFLGQFIDHDLTLNAVNLFDPQGAPDIRSQASPLIDLDSVYGPRLDDGATMERTVPITDGKFQLTPIAGSDGYDVCRQWDPASCSCAALIGDKRNDENQLILQVHIAAMRLHNYFVDRHHDFLKAKRDTILHWQAMVATYYLSQVARPEAIRAVKDRLFDPQRRDTLCHRPGLTSCRGTTLGMPHEFAIGFRFGHSQLRSEYVLRDAADPIRLFDPLATDTTHDLQGGKRLTADHLVDWDYFTDPDEQRSNLIDREVNEVVFALPESTIPDDIKLVNNLPLRNLVRSDAVSLCAGEDLAECYCGCYQELAIHKLTGVEVEHEEEYRPLFKIDPETSCDIASNEFRTPLWYYLLREAEVAREDESESDPNYGRLGMVGSLLVAEVILSGIYYARLSGADPNEEMSMCISQRRDDSTACSIFEDPAWAGLFHAWGPLDAPLKTLVDLVNLGKQSVPATCQPSDC